MHTCSSLAVRRALPSSLPATAPCRPCSPRQSYAFGIAEHEPTTTPLAQSQRADGIACQRSVTETEPHSTMLRTGWRSAAACDSEVPAEHRDSLALPKAAARPSQRARRRPNERGAHALLRMSAALRWHELMAVSIGLEGYAYGSFHHRRGKLSCKLTNRSGSELVLRYDAVVKRTLGIAARVVLRRCVIGSSDGS